MSRDIELEEGATLMQVGRHPIAPRAESSHLKL